MRLTDFTDYSLRVLIYLASHTDRLVTIQEIATSHGISKSHLTKVVHQLGLAGLVDTLRGRAGGIRLARAPGDIGIGQVVRLTEPDLSFVACFDPGHTLCMLAGDCALKHAIGSAAQAFLAELDRKTLADMVPLRGKDGIAGRDRSITITARAA
ncbi:Rrf2 family transcriptional regulator [Noviherbaspirillum galbum]|uniref:Rrf2 family transcriptional regulator n=1 Tax=Noviherbaspirillum galbum TaxID=2709383 RepID=A0A6B3SU53_9BURK|nr:Rrf2 family transcriptional regulator [Noviherbaspirillum galbum]NEX62406.1 Rrf2 family transcriptional regulator [Noviherbaspirillum galbum]